MKLAVRRVKARLWRQAAVKLQIVPEGTDPAGSNPRITSFITAKPGPPGLGVVWARTSNSDIAVLTSP